MKTPLLDKHEREVLQLDREHGIENHFSRFLKIQKAKREFGRAIQDTFLFRFIERILNRMS